MRLALDEGSPTRAPYCGTTPSLLGPTQSQPVQQWQSQAAPPAAAPTPETAPAAPAAAGEPAPGPTPAPAPAAAPEGGAPAPTPEQVAAAAAFQQPVVKAEKPDFVPDDFWDAEKGAVKTEDLTAALDELKTLKAPRAPEDYKIDVPADVAKEMGYEDGQPVFDPDAPLTKLLPGILSEMGANPEKLGSAMAKVAQILRDEEKALTVDMVAEVGKMGENAPRRLDAMRTYITANLPENMANDLLYALGRSHAGALSAFEKLLNTSRGLSSPSGDGGGGGANDDNLTPTERLAKVFENGARSGKGRRA